MYELYSENAGGGWSRILGKQAWEDKIRDLPSATATVTAAMH